MPFVSVLALSFLSDSIEAASKAQIWMMASAIFGWCAFSILTLNACKHFGLFDQPIPKLPLVRCGAFVCLATVLALIEELFTQFMTEHAQMFGVQNSVAYITPSLDYWDTVMHHSVVVFVPMFVVCATLSERWKFSSTEVFYLVGITGLTAEMTMNPASLFMGFWLLIYGFMVLAPSKWLYRDPQKVERRWWHYPSTIVLMLTAAAFASLVIHAIFPQHPDNHFSKKALSSLTVGQLVLHALPPIAQEEGALSDAFGCDTRDCSRFLGGLFLQREKPLF